MIFLNKVSRAVLGLEKAAEIVGTTGANVAAREFIKSAKSTLEGIQDEMNTLYGKCTVAEGSRDAVLMAIAGTSEGRGLDITKPEEVLPLAMQVIRTMDADIRTMREAEEIPFGAVEQDHDKMQLEQRVAELELQFELKVDECAETENHLREFKARWVSLINLINKLDPDGVSIGGKLPGVLLNAEATIFRRRYYHNGANVGGIIYGFDSNLTDEVKVDIANKIEQSKGEANFKNMFVNKKADHGCECKLQESASHELKILPEFFNAVISGHKKAEIRQADRLFSVGDELWLREWTVQDGYTGRDVYTTITHVTELSSYAPGYVMLSIESNNERGREALEEKYIEKYRAKHA